MLQLVTRRVTFKSRGLGVGMSRVGGSRKWQPILRRLQRLKNNLYLTCRGALPITPYLWLTDYSLLLRLHLGLQKSGCLGHVRNSHLYDGAEGIIPLLPLPFFLAQALLFFLPQPCPLLSALPSCRPSCSFSSCFFSRPWFLL